MLLLVICLLTYFVVISCCIGLCVIAVIGFTFGGFRGWDGCVVWLLFCCGAFERVCTDGLWVFVWFGWFVFDMVVGYLFRDVTGYVIYFREWFVLFLLGFAFFVFVVGVWAVRFCIMWIGWVMC